MSKYVSEVITENIIKTLNKGYNYLIGSEMGSGKNYWIRNVLLPFADKLSKKTLILSHRTATRDQQDFYLRDWEYSQMRKFRGGLFTNITYQQFENKILNKEFDYLNQFTFIVADEAHYFTSDCIMNAKTDLSFEWLNNNDSAIKFFLTATYKSFEYLPFDDMEQLKQADFYNSKVEELYCYKNISEIIPIIEEKVFNGEKILCIFDKIQEGKAFINTSNTNCALLTAGNKEDNKEYNSLVYKQSLNSDVLVSTSLLSEGVEIKDKETKTIILDGMTDIERFVQTTGRIRDNKVEVYYKKPSHQKIINRYVKYRNLLELIGEFESIGEIEYIKKYGIDTVQKSHKFIKLDTVLDAVSHKEYSRVSLHKCNVANIRYQHDMYLDILDNGFENVLAEYFPKAKFNDYSLMKSKKLVESKILDDFTGKRLFKEEQQNLKNLLIKEYGFKKSSLSSINKEFEEKNISYKLKSKIVRVNNERFTTWILESTKN